MKEGGGAKQNKKTQNYRVEVNLLHEQNLMLRQTIKYYFSTLIINKYRLGCYCVY